MLPAQRKTRWKTGYFARPAISFKFVNPWLFVDKNRKIHWKSNKIWCLLIIQWLFNSKKLIYHALRARKSFFLLRALRKYFKWFLKPNRDGAVFKIIFPKWKLLYNCFMTSDQLPADNMTFCYVFGFDIVLCLDQKRVC